MKKKIKTLLDFNKGEHVESMSLDVTKIMLMAAMADQNGPTWFDPNDEKMLIGVSAQMLAKRWPFYGIGQVSVGAVALILGLCDRPAYLSAWAYALAVLGRRLGKGIVLQDIVDVFPDGFPTAKAFHECWIAQKIDQHGLTREQVEAHGGWGDNLIDCPALLED